MKKYLVTGGCGFVGSHLCEKLIRDGHQVRVLDNLTTGKEHNISPDIELIHGDIRDFETVKKAFSGLAGCFHLAAIPSPTFNMDNWYAQHSINLSGTMNVFKAAVEENNLPVVYASSCAVYGNSSQLPYHEKAFIQPISAYGGDKYSCEINAYFLSVNFQVPLYGLRIFNIYGPRQNPSSPYSGVITRFIKNAMNDKPLIIYGDGEQTRDFVYILDVVDALTKIMSLRPSSKYAVINVCTGEVVTINELATTILKILNKSVPIEYQPARTFDTLHSQGNPELTRSIGIETAYSLEEGLRYTVEYYLKNS